MLYTKDEVRRYVNTYGRKNLFDLCTDQIDVAIDIVRLYPTYRVFLRNTCIQNEYHVIRWLEEIGSHDDQFFIDWIKNSATALFVSEIIGHYEDLLIKIDNINHAVQWIQIHGKDTDYLYEYVVKHYSQDIVSQTNWNSFVSEKYQIKT